MKHTLKALLVTALIATGAARAATLNGDLDRNFGEAGQVRVDIGDVTYTWANMAISANDDILLVGSYDAGLPSGVDFIVARLHADGSLDTGFSFDGKVEIAVGPGASEDQVLDVLIQSDGQIVLVGNATSPDENDGIDMAIVRLNADGTLDGGFGVGGKVFIDFGLGGDDVNENTRAIADFADGKLVVVGSTFVTGEDTDMAVVKLNTDGTRDTSFGTGGRVVVDFGLNASFPSDSALSVAVDPQGRVVVAGATLKGSVTDLDFAIARLLDNGQLDPAFNGDGRATVAFDIAGELRDTLLGLLVEDDGSLTLTGFASDVSWDMAVARLNSDGSPVAGFGNGGRTTIPFDQGGSNSDVGIDAVRAADGRLLVVGQVLGAAQTYSGLVQLLPNGALDPDFGIVGKALVGSDFGGSQSSATVVRIVNHRAIIGGVVTDASERLGLMSAAILIDVVFSADFDQD